MSHSEDDLCQGTQAIVAALAWKLSSGWPTSSRDLALAGRIWARLETVSMTAEERSARYLEKLVDAYERTGDAAVHRAVLARLILHASGLSS